MSIIEMSMSASLFTTAIIIIRRFALDKFPKAVFSAFWLIAALRLLIPVGFSSNLSVYAWLQSNINYTVVNAPAQAAQTAAHYPGGSINPFTALSPNGSAAEEAGMPEAAVSPLLIAWLIGVAAVTLYFIVTNVKSQRGFKSSLPVDSAYISGFVERSGLSRRVEVRVSDRVSTPLTYGLIKPVILLPKNLDHGGGQLKYILTHELLHIKRLDLLKKLVFAAALIIHWFNPLAWAMYVLANRDLELHCDEGVVRAFGKSHGAAYATALIDLQEVRGAAAFCSGFSKFAIKERITSIMKYRKGTIVSIILSLALLVGITSAFASTNAPRPLPAPPEAQTEQTGPAPPESAPATESVAPQSEPIAPADVSNILSYTDLDTGETRFSVDNGVTWMSEEEFLADNTAPEYWTYDGFKAFVESQEPELRKLIGQEAAFNTQLFDTGFTWGEESAGEAIDMYYDLLEDIGKGAKIAKTVDSIEDLAIVEYCGEAYEDELEGDRDRGDDDRDIFDSRDRDRDHDRDDDHSRDRDDHETRDKSSKPGKYLRRQPPAPTEAPIDPDPVPAPNPAPDTVEPEPPQPEIPPADPAPVPAN